MLLVEGPQLSEHLLRLESTLARLEDLAGRKKPLWLHDALEYTLGTNPFFGRIPLTFALQLDRAAMINVVADVLLVGEHV